MSDFKISFDVSKRDVAHGGEAARSMAKYDGTVRAHIDRSTVAIAGARDTKEALLYWRIALLNERLLAEAAAEREAILALLVA